MIPNVLTDRKVQEVVSRSFLGLVKLGVTAALFIGLQNLFYKTANNVIEGISPISK